MAAIILGHEFLASFPAAVTPDPPRLLSASALWAADRRHRARGVADLEAPVSGAPTAKAGPRTVMVGGDREVLAAARPVLETFAAQILYFGETGAGGSEISKGVWPLGRMRA